jgi:hypothetical protein
VRNSSRAGNSITLLIGALGLIILSGGATNTYSQILTLLLTGAVLVVFPPRFLPGKWILGCLLAIVLWSLGTSWLELPFSSPRDWLVDQIPELQLADSGAVQPWLSLEKVGFLTVGIMWVLLILANPLSHKERINRMRWLVWFLIACAMIVIVGVVLGLQHPFSWGTHKFSFFPNHNQTGIVLAMGGILCSGLINRSLRRKSWTSLIYFVGYGIICLALFLGMSRSAILIMGAGSGIYLMATFDKKNSDVFFKLGIPVLIMLVAAFALYGNHLLREFAMIMSRGGLQDELRLLIYMDAFSMVGTFPISGVGLGNFRYFFPAFRDQVGVSVAPIHPESDLLWVACELGLVGLLIIIVGVSAMLMRLDIRKMISDRGSRLCAFVAVCFFLFGSLIEVSGHRLGSVLLAVVLYGIAQPEKPRLRESRFLAWFSRFVGVGFWILAGFWIHKVTTGEPITSSEVIRYASASHGELLNLAKDEAELKERIDSYVKRYPLMSSLLDHQAVGLLRTGESVDRADTIFRSVQKLKPKAVDPCIRHGVYMLPYSFDLALSYWTLGMQRSSGNEQRVFSEVLRNVPKDAYEKLRDLTFDNPELQFILLSRIRSQKREYSRMLGLELAINPGLEGFASEQKQALLWQYTRINGATFLQRLLSIHPELGSENWSLRSILAAANGDYKEASRLAIMNLPEPEMVELTRGRTYTAIHAEYRMDQDDPLKLIALVQKHKEDGTYLKAAAAIELGIERNVRHEYLDFQLPLMHFYLGNYEESWKGFEEIIRQNLKWAPYLIE